MSESHSRSSEPDEGPLPPLGTAPGRDPSDTRPGLSRRKAPEPSPWGLIALGAVVWLLGGFLLTGPGDLFRLAGYLSIGLGSIFVAIGTIAEGIRLGARWAAFDRGD